MSAISDVVNERLQQDVRWGEQNHPNGTDPEAYFLYAKQARELCDRRHAAGEGTWLDILREEVYGAFAETDPTRLRRELIQVAAVACAWVECIDRRERAAA